MAKEEMLCFCNRGDGVQSFHLTTILLISEKSSPWKFFRNQNKGETQCRKPFVDADARSPKN